MGKKIEYELVPAPVKLKEIEEMRWKAQELVQHLYQTEYDPLYEEMKLVKEFWGYRTHSKGQEPSLIVFEIDEGICQHHEDHHSAKHIQTLPIEDIMLLIDEDERTLEPAAIKAIKDRIENKTQQLPERQDLVTRYYRQDLRRGRLYRIIGAAKDLIQRYIESACYERYKKEIRWSVTMLVKFIINGREYISMIGGGSITQGIVQKPEDPIRILTEEELLKDEAEQPYIHGIRMIRRKEVPREKALHKRSDGARVGTRSISSKKK